MLIKPIKFDLNKYRLYERLKAKQGDTESRFLLFQLLDGSLPFNLENRSVRAYMIKPDGKEVFNDLIVNDRVKGYCTLELTNQVLAAPGTVKLELMVIEGTKKLTSSVFELEVEKSINSEKSIVSTNEFGALLKGLASLNEYDNYKNEIAEARDGEKNLLTKVKKIDEQLETIAAKPYSKSINKATLNKSVITFYFDDGQKEDYTVAKPILDKYGFGATICVIPDYIERGLVEFSTLEKLKELESSGWEIDSHTYHGKNLTKVSIDEADTELRTGKEWLNSKGFKANNVCYPEGGYNDDIMVRTRKYYRCGLASINKVNVMPINTYNINRYFIDGSLWTLDQMKTLVDGAKTSTQWLVFYGHPATWNDDVKTKFDGLCAYVKASGIDVKNVDQALDVFENKLDIGDETSNYFKIGADGNVDMKIPFNSVFLGRNSGIKNDTPISAFPKYKISNTAFNASEKSNIPICGGAGTLFTYRLHYDDSMSYQIFVGYDGVIGRRTWKNTWNDATSMWNEWIYDTLSGATIRDNTPITSFPTGLTNTIFKTGDGGDINGVVGAVGILTTYRPSGFDSLSYQEWNPINSNIVYRRHWINSLNIWSSWATPYKYKTGGLQAQLGIVEANSMSTIDIPCPDLVTNGAINVTFLSNVPDNILYTCSIPTNGTLRVKLYNISNERIGVGTCTLQVVQF